MKKVMVGIFTLLFVGAVQADSKDEAVLSEPEAQVRAVIERYAQGTYEGSAEKLESVFHTKAVMNGYLMGKLLMATPAVFIADIQKNPMKDSGANYQYEIAEVDIDGKVASVEFLESGFPGDGSFTNYFHLIDDGSGWKIISKTFYGRAP